MSDLISRRAVMDATEGLKKHCDVRKLDFEIIGYNIALNDVKDAILGLPSAEPERKKGKWIELANTNHTYICSVCGRILVNIIDDKKTVTKNYPFCHCGAKMEEVEDE